MNDFKNLRYELRIHAEVCGKYKDQFLMYLFGKLFAQAADAIEALTTERDAAIADLKTVFGKCSYCKFFKQGAFGGQCQSTPNPGKCWQWRGVQHDGEKED